MGAVSHSHDEIKAALKRSRGLIAPAARALGVERTTLYRRIERSQALREILDEERAGLTDLAEQRLAEAIDAGNFKAIRFYLATQGRERGYGEKQTIEHDGTDSFLQALREFGARHGA